MTVIRYKVFLPITTPYGDFDICIINYRAIKESLYMRGVSQLD